MTRSIAPPILALALLAALSASGRGQADPLVERGVAYLKGGGASGGAGESALAALALIKAEVPNKDPALLGYLGVALKRFNGSSYQPELGGGTEIYEASVIILALANHDSAEHRGEIEAAARYILGKQNSNGSWDYQGRSFGDTSISQYAVLGLWEAENAGISIPPSAWDRAAAWFLSTQDAAGGWAYHRDEAGNDRVSMTAAGVGSLLICARQLAPYRNADRSGPSLLTPLVGGDDRRRASVGVPAASINAAVGRGIGWIARTFPGASVEVIGPSTYYTLYGIERVGSLADLPTFGKLDWFAEGRKFIAASQSPDGSCTKNSAFGSGPNTSWAILFLTRSTAKTIRKINVRRLGSGTLVGGRGLPKDLSQVSVAAGKVVARPMDGAVEGMLAALEDPRIEDASAALAGLVARYGTEGAAALRPHEDRFRKLLSDRDQGVRRVAAWALARTDDLSTAPLLIAALEDPDEGVVREARLGLQLQARLIDGLGPPDGVTPAQKAEAAARWRAWYDSVRPIAAHASAPAAANPGTTGGGRP